MQRRWWVKPWTVNILNKTTIVWLTIYTYIYIYIHLFNEAMNLVIQSHRTSVNREPHCVPGLRLHSRLSWPVHLHGLWDILCLVVWNMFYFYIYTYIYIYIHIYTSICIYIYILFVEFYHPNWRAHIFFRGVSVLNHQAVREARSWASWSSRPWDTSTKWSQDGAPKERCEGWICWLKFPMNTMYIYIYT